MKTAIISTAAAINAFEPGSVTVAGKIPQKKMVHTGIKSLDLALGGGIPRGTIVELCGESGGGRTTVALHIANKGKPALFIDADRAIPPWATNICNPLYTAYPDTLETALDIIQAGSAGFSVIVLDSLPALPTKNDLAGKLYQRKDTDAAEVLSRRLPCLRSAVIKNHCTLIICNQFRGSNRLIQLHRAGGRALSHFTDCRIRVEYLEAVRKDSEIAGQRILFRVEKSRFSIPGKTSTAEIIYNGH